MIRMVGQLTIGILANAVGLLAASLLLADFEIAGAAFVVAVLIFSVATAVLSPLILKIAVKNASFLVGGISLVTILAGLFVTTLVSDGIAISGLSTWILATLIVWIFSIIGNLLLPLVIFKSVLNGREGAANQGA